MNIPPTGQNQIPTNTNTWNTQNLRGIAPFAAIQQVMISLQVGDTDSRTARKYANHLAIEHMRAVAIDSGNEVIRNANIQYQAAMEKAMGVFEKKVEK